VPSSCCLTPTQMSSLQLGLEASQCLWKSRMRVCHCFSCVTQALTIHLRDPPGDILIFMTGDVFSQLHKKSGSSLQAPVARRKSVPHLA